MDGLMIAISFIEGHLNHLLSMVPICINFQKRNDALVQFSLFQIKEAMQQRLPQYQISKSFKQAADIKDIISLFMACMNLRRNTKVFHRISTISRTSLSVRAVQHRLVQQIE